ncbi:Radicicol biosynthesis cluster regulator [Hyphodiscus hymeniophilus]|uniref:Radicicol biosynthesis cluster regulator n=1 Tax=Hyphodiscus hymeniophilus TaxID=353542 RepID=A0A9P6VDE9_9HELO|nr:Radicicol biosynthesis cluster regulator [Hyphodiscus hymeniophilus]
MPQQNGVRGPEDDWAGLNDPKERRKLQNRLNQRLWRKRQRVKKVKTGQEKAKPADSTSRGSKIWDSSLPENFRPTVLQHTVEHHPWIDLFPIPTMRDNLLRAGAAYDNAEICLDIVEVGEKPKEKAGLIVWGEPWDVYAWGASPAFLRKWGWSVEGCYDLLKSTNHWRMERGEKRIGL